MTAKAGQIIIIDSKEFVVIGINDSSVEVKDCVKGKSKTLLIGDLGTLKDYSVTDRTYRDLGDCDLWVKARVLEALNIKYVLEVLNEKQL